MRGNPDSPFTNQPLIISEKVREEVLVPESRVLVLGHVTPTSKFQMIKLTNIDLYSLRPQFEGEIR